MPKRVITNGHVTLDGNDISSYCAGFTLTRDGGVVEVSTFGSTAKQREGGLLDNNLSLEVFHTDDDQLNAWFYSAVGTKVAFLVKAVDDTVTTSNPSFAGNCILGGYDPLTGSVGAASSTTINCPVDGEVTRATS